MKRQRFDFDIEFRDFVTDLFAAAGALQSVRRAVARRCRMGGTEFGILLAVARLSPDGPVSVRDVAEHLHVAAPHITAEVNSLVKTGILKKVASRVDSRAVQLTLSSSGQALLDSLSPVLVEMNAVMFAGLSATVRAKHGSFFRELVARTPATLAALMASPLISDAADATPRSRDPESQPRGRRGKAA